MKHFTLTKKEIKKHTLLWSIVILLVMILDPVPGNIKVNIIGGIFVFANYIFLYYALALYVFPNFFRRQLLNCLISLVSVFIIFLSIKYLRANYIVPMFGGEASLYGKPIIRFLSDGLLQISIIGSSAYVFYLNKLKIYKLSVQKQNEEILINNELDFLKGQFNTHLTFNFLNFCYSHLNQYSEKATNSIEVFSDMLEHSLSTKLEEYVPLEQEAEYVNNYISLQKAISSDIHADFSYSIDGKNKMILPHLLITFVENAFSYGVVNNNNYPININLRVTEELLTFSIEYLISKNKKVPSTKIGEGNLKQLLQMYYKEKFQLSINSLNNLNTCKLIIGI